jgi:DNA primase catalytic subunit
MTNNNDIEEEEQMQVDRPVEVRPFYRELGFSSAKQDGTVIFWRDKKHKIRSGPLLVKKLWKRGPEQLHFGRLHLYDQQGDAVLDQMELVFDIDVTDYRQYCECAGKGKACPQCWLHIEGACLLLEHWLVSRLGIAKNHLLWVLSGKKGVHCLVNAPHYVGMDLSRRAQLFARIQCGDSLPKLKEYAQSLQHEPVLLAEMEQQFLVRVVRLRRLFENEEFLRDCLTNIVQPYFPALYHHLEARWFPLTTTTSKDSLMTLSEERWLMLRKLERGQFSTVVTPSLMITLHLYYPRIDRGPLCEKKHLIKLPFSVHKDTRNVALPVERTDIVDKQGLPLTQLSFKDLMKHYREKQQRHPEYERACLVFERWVQAY